MINYLACVNSIFYNLLRLKTVKHLENVTTIHYSNSTNMVLLSQIVKLIFVFNETV